MPGVINQLRILPVIFLIPAIFSCSGGGSDQPKSLTIIPDDTIPVKSGTPVNTHLYYIGKIMWIDQDRNPEFMAKLTNVYSQNPNEKYVFNESGEFWITKPSYDLSVRPYIYRRNVILSCIAVITDNGKNFYAHIRIIFKKKSTIV